MKKLTLMLLITILSLTGYAQNVKLDAAGNYIAITKKKGGTEAKLIGKTFTDAKGIVYPIYLSKNNKMFIIRTSKTGNEYNQYLKL